MELNHAVTAWLIAETNRDRKRQRRPFSISQWTVSGLAKQSKPRRRKASAPETTWGKVTRVMSMFGGK